MPDYFAVDPESLAKDAPNMRAFSDQVRGIVTRLQGGLDSLGECWGTDPMGRAFANNYLSPRDEIFTGLSGMADVLDSTADGMENMAKGFADTEATNVASARNLTRGSTGTPSGTTPDPSTGAHGRPRA